MDEVKEELKKEKNSVSIWWLNLNLSFIYEQRNNSYFSGSVSNWCPACFVVIPECPPTLKDTTDKMFNIIHRYFKSYKYQNLQIFPIFCTLN